MSFEYQNPCVSAAAADAVAALTGSDLYAAMTAAETSGLDSVAVLRTSLPSEHGDALSDMVEFTIDPSAADLSATGAGVPLLSLEAPQLSVPSALPLQPEAVVPGLTSPSMSAYSVQSCLSPSLSSSLSPSMSTYSMSTNTPVMSSSSLTAPPISDMTLPSDLTLPSDFTLPMTPTQTLLQLQACPSVDGSDGLSSLDGDGDDDDDVARFGYDDHGVDMDHRTAASLSVLCDNAHVTCDKLRAALLQPKRARQRQRKRAGSSESARSALCVKHAELDVLNCPETERAALLQRLQHEYDKLHSQAAEITKGSGVFFRQVKRGDVDATRQKRMDRKRAASMMNRRRVAMDSLMVKIDVLKTARVLAERRTSLTAASHALEHERAGIMELEARKGELEAMLAAERAAASSLDQRLAVARERFRVLSSLQAVQC